MERKTMAKKARYIRNTGLALTTALGISISGALEVNACIYPETIIIEQNETQDILNRKLSEADIIDGKFTSTVYETIDPAIIEHAICLSDALNEYLPSPSKYSNTTLQEIINCDIESIYQEYSLINQEDQESLQDFCEKYKEQQAAIDGVTLFGYRVVSSAIKQDLGYAVEQYFKDFNSSDLIESPKVIMSNQPYIIYNYGTHMFKVLLAGQGIEEIKKIYTTLDEQYQMVYDLISGHKKEYSDSFIYQGADPTNTWSVYLSSGNDNRKNMLYDGLVTIGKINNNKYEFEINTAPYNDELSNESIEELIELGYNIEEIKNTHTLISYIQSVSKEDNLSYKK